MWILDANIICVGFLYHRVTQMLMWCIKGAPPFYWFFDGVPYWTDSLRVEVNTLGVLMLGLK
jgi:hypothetical protein